jgi:hypothetical protein
VVKDIADYLKPDIRKESYVGNQVYYNITRDKIQKTVDCIVKKDNNIKGTKKIPY